jgi:serine-type D-Ala-D-Ala carboxypeptidase (penicillin-binding protein 5/6)
MGEEEVTRIPLVALQDLPKGGLWRQAKDSVLRMF